MHSHVGKGGWVANGATFDLWLLSSQDWHSMSEGWADTMERLAKVRRMQLSDKLADRAIAKRTGLSRNTVHKWRQTPKGLQVPKYVQAKGCSKLGVPDTRASFDALPIAVEAAATPSKRRLLRCRKSAQTSKAEKASGANTSV